MVIQQWSYNDGFTASKANSLTISKRAEPITLSTITDGDLFYNETKDELMTKIDGRLSYVNRVPSGIIRPFAGLASNIPDGWLRCNGSEISSTTYSELFEVLGSIVSSTGMFRLPDLETGNRFVNCITNDEDVGSTGGETEHTLTIDEMAAHTHRIISSRHEDLFATTRYTLATSSIGATATDTTSVGGGQPHNNIPTNLSMYYIIKT